MERTIKELQAEKINVHGMPCHVGKDADRKALVQETMAKFGGRIDAFVSNAAVNPAYGPILDTTEDQWDKLFDINVKAAFLLCKGVSLPSSASAAPRASSMQSKLLAAATVRCNMLLPVARSCTECLAVVALCRGFADNAEAAGRLGCLCIVYRGVHSKPGHYYTYLAAGATQEPPPPLLTETCRYRSGTLPSPGLGGIRFPRRLCWGFPRYVLACGAARACNHVKTRTAWHTGMCVCV